MSNYKTIDIPEVSIVILCYKEGEAIKQFAKKTIDNLEANKIYDYELILVGNYHEDSDDQTPKVVAELAAKNPKILYVARPKQGMMGWDMKSGLYQANGRYIAVIDGDGQMPIEDLVKVYEKIKVEKLDLVKTYRAERGDNRWRKLLNTFYNIFFRILFPGLHSRDINSKPKIMTRDAYQKLNLVSDDWFIDAEIMIQARRFSFKIGEIPTRFKKLSGRRKSYVGISTVFEFIKNLVIFRLAEFKQNKQL